MTYADAHCHLQDPRLTPHLPVVLRLAREAGVTHVHTNATCEANWTATDALESPSSPTTPTIHVSFGIHPWYAAETTPGWPGRLKTLLLAHPRAGVGEAGLDGSLPGGLTDTQWTAFRTQWDISVSLRRPISLHGRGAWPPLLDFLLSQPPHPAGVLLHAYGGSPDALPALAAKNISISIGASLMNPSNRRARRIAAAAVPGHFLLETDSPDMPPPDTPHSEPSQIPATAALWSSLLSLPLSDFATQTTATFLRLFP